MTILRIFVLGLGILAGALILNYLASLLGLMSWFEYVQNPLDAEAESLIWLYVAYPFGLGLLAVVLKRVLRV